MDDCDSIFNNVFEGSLQISSDQKGNINDSNASFSINIQNGLRGNGLVLDSIILTNDIPLINIWNYQYRINGINYNLIIENYNNNLDLVTSLSSQLSSSVGHLISFIIADGRITIIGTIGFTDIIDFDVSIRRMLGTNNIITIVDIVPLMTPFIISSIPRYSQWLNIGISGTHIDRSFSYGNSQTPITSCVSIGNYGDQIVHREVQYRLLNISNFISNINVQVHDEYRRLAPMGNNSIVINFFYY